MWCWVKAKWKWTRRHLTKVLGLSAAAVAYGQNNLAQLGHIVSPQWQGGILATFGVLAFALGLGNTFFPPDQEPPT